ncbi:hypothetical protein JTE90_003025 [Oedothorax gibbosus]|uniref:Uncharacterized protein n=1 Tax=Oedothorax gibbosus TaxID=931172 RepID=A0AAV6VBM0_9ARAC|nr:hypothetical protein JTE90_003025 [Oedothorax gibbosus]
MGIKRDLLIYLWISSIFSCIHSKKDVVCELAAFIEDPDGSNPQRIDSGKGPASLSDCDEESQKKCIKAVEHQVKEGTRNGNFSLSIDQEEYTIGDVLCDKADQVQENVRNKMVQIYWRLCDSKWQKTSFRMPEPLCCDDGLYVPCKIIYS